MDSDEAPRIIAWGACGRLSRREVIARPTTPGSTFGPSTTLTPIPAGQNLTLFCRETRNIADWRRTA